MSCIWRWLFSSTHYITSTCYTIVQWYEKNIRTMHGFTHDTTLKNRVKLIWHVPIISYVAFIVFVLVIIVITNISFSNPGQLVAWCTNIIGVDTYLFVWQATGAHRLDVINSDLLFRLAFASVQNKRATIKKHKRSKKPRQVGQLLLFEYLNTKRLSVVKYFRVFQTFS